MNFLKSDTGKCVIVGVAFLLITSYMMYRRKKPKDMYIEECETMHS